MINLEYLRSFRIGEYSIFDLVISFLGILLISPLLTKVFKLIHLEIPLKSWLFFTLPLAIFAHILVGQNTLMTTYFLDPHSHYLLKISIVILFLIGVLQVKSSR